MLIAAHAGLLWPYFLLHHVTFYQEMNELEADRNEKAALKKVENRAYLLTSLT